MMKKHALLAAMSAMTLSTLAVAPAVAQDYDHHYDRGREYYGHDRHYHDHGCGGGNGAVGTIAGGVGGAVLGSALGGGTLGTVAGGVGGGLLGRHFDKQHTRHERGC